MYDPTLEGKSLLKEINMTLETTDTPFHINDTSNTEISELKEEYKIAREKHIHLSFLSKKISAYTNSLKSLLEKYKKHMSINGMCDKLRNEGVCYCVCLADINDVNDSNVVVCDSDNCKIGWYHKEHVKMVNIDGLVICEFCNKKAKKNTEA